MTIIQLCSSGGQHYAHLPHEFSDAVEVCLVLGVGVVVQFEGLAGAAGHGLVRGAQLQRILGLTRRVDGSSLPGAACSGAAQQSAWKGKIRAIAGVVRHTYI